jgi:hypothetical protein
MMAFQIASEEGRHPRGGFLVLDVALHEQMLLPASAARGWFDLLLFGRRRDDNKVKNNNNLKPNKAIDCSSCYKLAKYS